MMDHGKKSNGAYTIAWICALEIEQAAAQGMLDVRHPQIPAAKGDSNAYRFGSIGEHDIVIAVLRSGTPGTTSAAVAATNVLRSFPNIRFGVLVGVGGGASVTSSTDPQKDIRLGDVVVSSPSGQHGGVVQYDFGKLLQDGTFVLTGSLNSPPTVLGTAVAALRGDARLYGYQIDTLVKTLCASYPDAGFARPRAQSDLLFASDNLHIDGKEDCAKCGDTVRRQQRRVPDIPVVHYGLIGSANRVLQDSVLRDMLHQEHGIICFEMEAAGLMQDFPCLVVRGISDYCDSHKNKQWQPYAAATAAAYTKELLLTIAPEQVAEETLAHVVLEKVQVLIPATQHVHDATLEIGDRLIFDLLLEAERATFDSFEFLTQDEQTDLTCMRDTRVALLHQIREWGTSAFEKSIFWLSGAAGTGKSTISRTIAQEFFDMEQLGASFFFKRNMGDRGNASRFFTTIAAQLARNIVPIRPLIAKALKHHPRIAEKGLAEQFGRLILDPLSNFQHEMDKPTLLVIDALDECEGDAHIRLIIALLSKTDTLIKSKLRILVTSRPELPVELGFRRISNFELLILQDIPAETTKDDILRYLEEKFRRIQDDNTHLSVGWPGKESLELLAKMACPLFIFAATVCRFVVERFSDPEEQLAFILKHRDSSFDQINRIYLPILQQLTHGQTGLQKKRMDDFRRSMGCIVVAFESISINTLAVLVESEPQSIRARLSALESVLRIPKGLDSPIALHHLSFANFLIDGNRRNEHEFWIDKKAIHRFLAARCLHLMLTSRHLKEDICDLRRPGCLRQEIDPSLVAVLPAEIHYACRYWTRHHKETGCWDAEFEQQISLLFNSRFLMWFEAVSLLGRASEMISMVTDLIETCPQTSECSTILHDAKRFILANAYIADLAPLQLYSSSVLFAPQQSWIRHHQHTPSWLCNLSTFSQQWDSLLQTLEGHTEVVMSLIYLSDRGLLASTSRDGTIKFWAVKTGLLQQTITCVSDKLWSMAYSAHEKLLAVGSFSGNIELRDAESGSLRQSVDAYTDIIQVLAFSPDSKLLASGSRDTLLKLWNFTSQVLSLHCTTEHSEEVYSLAFSPDGKVLTSGSISQLNFWIINSGSLDRLHTLVGAGAETLTTFLRSGELFVTCSSKALQLWTLSRSGLELGQIDTVPLEYAHSATLSADEQIVAVCTSYTMEIWTITPQRLLHLRSIQTRGDHDELLSMTFLSRDTLLATGSIRGPIRLWEINPTDARSQDFMTNSDRVNVLTFSSDGKLFVNGVDDSTVDQWNIESGRHLLEQSFEVHSDRVISIAFSLDNLLLALGSVAGMIELWYLASGELSQSFRAHAYMTHCIAFSRDGALLVSGSIGLLAERMEVKIWSANSLLLQRAFMVPKWTFSPCNIIACSSDGTTLAYMSSNSEMLLWDTIVQRRKLTIRPSRTINRVRFSEDGFHLETNLGNFGIQEGTTTHLRRTEEPAFELHEGWIRRNGQRLLWLPSDYRRKYDSCGDAIAFGPNSGSFVTLVISSAQLKEDGLLEDDQADDAISYSSASESEELADSG